MFALTLPNGILRSAKSSLGNASARAANSVASPTCVEVACASMYCTSCGPKRGGYARCMASVWPSLRGAQRLFPLPSADMPIPRITQRIRSPSANAFGRVFKTSVTKPSAVTNPEALASKGRDLPAETDCACENSTNESLLQNDAPPTTAMSI